MLLKILPYGNNTIHNRNFDRVAFMRGMDRRTNGSEKNENKKSL